MLLYGFYIPLSLRGEIVPLVSSTSQQFMSHCKKCLQLNSSLESTAMESLYVRSLTPQFIVYYPSRKLITEELEEVQENRRFHQLQYLLSRRRQQDGSSASISDLSVTEDVVILCRWGQKDFETCRSILHIDWDPSNGLTVNETKESSSAIVTQSIESTTFQRRKGKLASNFVLYRSHVVDLETQLQPSFEALFQSYEHSIRRTNSSLMSATELLSLARKRRRVS